MSALQCKSGSFSSKIRVKWGKNRAKRGYFGVKTGSNVVARPYNPRKKSKFDAHDRKTRLFQARFEHQMLVVIKLPYLKSTILCSKLSKGMGHNYYGEPA